MAKKSDVGSPKVMRIWVLPVGKGDSIIVQLPDGSWGIVDSSYMIRKKKAAAVPLLLEAMELDEKIRFICLTHYHKDHYHGLLEIFRTMAERCHNDGEFFHCGFALADAYKSVGWAGLEELLELRQTFFAKGPGARRPLTERYGINESNRPFRLSDDVELRFLAPADEAFRSWNEALLGSAKKGKQHPRPFNRLGIAFTLTYGDAVVLFTDDIEESAWKRIKRSGNQLAPCWMMVSHHGAKRNNPSWLWPWLAADRDRSKLHAVISANVTTHPSSDVVTQADDFFNVHKTYSEDYSGPGTSSPLETFGAGPGPSPRSGLPSQTWIDAAFPKGRVCSFEIHSSGKVVPTY